MMHKKIFPVLFIGLAFTTQPTESCTNYIVTRGASSDGSVMMTYSADSHTLYGELYHWPSARYPEGTLMEIHEWDTGKFLGKIPQVPETYHVTGNMNQYQVAIGESTFGGKEELVDTTGIMDYGSLMYIALQRSKTAREAIGIITSLVKEYGYYSSGESFSIIDKEEAWILEMIGKGPGRKGALWVAVRIPDGYVSGHANQARIRTFPLNDPENCLYEEEVISFAREKGWFSGKDSEFSFSDTYAPVDFMGARACEMRVWTFFHKVADGMDQYWDYVTGANLGHRMPLYIKPDRKIEPREVMNAMRDHLEGTELDMSLDLGAGPFGLPYRWRPMEFEVDGKAYVHERTTATQQTGWWFMAQARSYLPDLIGGIFWFGVDDTGTSCLTPIYASSTEVPHSYAQGNGDLLTYREDAAFWIFTRVAHIAYLRYRDIYPDIRKVIDQLESEALSIIPAVDATATALMKTNPGEARKFLTQYSVGRAEYTIQQWKELYAYLMVKYSDGNRKKEAGGQFMRNAYGQPESPDHPGYSPSWLRRITEDHGEKILIPRNN